MNKKITVSVIDSVFVLTALALVVFMATYTALSNSFKRELTEFYKGSEYAAKVNEITSYIEKYYLGEIDDKAVEKEIFGGYVSGIGEEYGGYFTREEFEEFEKSNQGKGYGMGVYLSYVYDICPTCQKTEPRNDSILVVRVSPDSPAYKAGVRQNDIITKFNGKSIGEDITLTEMSNEIKNGLKSGDTVLLELVSASTRELYTASVVIGEFTEKSIVYGMLPDNKTAIIRIFEFNKNTFDEFKKAVEETKSSGAKQYIFDLRDNGGGLLDSVCSIIDTMVPKDSVITTLRDKNDTAVKEYKAENGGSLGAPAVILTNGSTASAAELFTSALKHYGVADVVGTNTYGKGVAQSYFTLSDGSGLGITTYYYDPPSGENYNGVGIAPDVSSKLSLGESIDCYGIQTVDTVMQKALDHLNTK